MLPIAKPKRWQMQATMIQGSSIKIGSYANLNMTSQVNEANLDSRYAFDLLRSNCSLAALVDANERYDPPRCAETTRRDIIQNMENWVRHESHDGSGIPSSIFWLYGGAGAGKSALAQTFAEKFLTNEDLAASFFFFRGDANRNDGNRLIPTLALQLVQSFQGLSPFVEEKILQKPELFNRSRQTQMLELLIEPLIRMSLEETRGGQSNPALKLHPRLVVIDGLDECNDPDTQCDLLRIIASAVPHLPYPLRFLITSRPESHITRVFQHDVGEVAHYDLSDDSDADKDIRIFLEGEFAKIHDTHPLRQHLPFQWPPWAAISSIVDRSSGHFIYASTVVRFIQSPKHRPDDRLQIILGLKQPAKKDQPYARLDSLYRLIFLEIQDPGQLEDVHRALGIMHLQSLKSGLLSRWSSDRYAVETLLGLRPGDLVLLFDGLLSLVTLDKDRIRIFHKSLFDYLLDSSRSGDLQLDLALAHETAANYILRGSRLRDPWDSEKFQHFAYHSQFARLNDTLRGHLLSLASNPQITFTESSLRHEESYLLRSTFYLLQAIGRQDLDSNGYYYRKYVEKNSQRLRSAIPLSQRLRCLVSRSTRLEVIQIIEGRLRLSFNSFFEYPDLEDVRRKDANIFNGRTRIPAQEKSVIKCIEHEHEMFSSYVKAHHRYPDIVVSFLESIAALVHSCHFVMQGPSADRMTFVMLITYTRRGVRLSCTRFDYKTLVYTDYDFLVRKHCQSTQSAIYNNHTKVDHCGPPLNTGSPVFDGRELSRKKESRRRPPQSQTRPFLAACPID